MKIFQVLLKTELKTNIDKNRKVLNRVNFLFHVIFSISTCTEEKN